MLNCIWLTLLEFQGQVHTRIKREKSNKHKKMIKMGCKIRKSINCEIVLNFLKTVICTSSQYANEGTNYVTFSLYIYGNFHSYSSTIGGRYFDPQYIAKNAFPHVQGGIYFFLHVYFNMAKNYDISYNKIHQK